MSFAAYHGEVLHQRGDCYKNCHYHRDACCAGSASGGHVVAILILALLSFTSVKQAISSCLLLAQRRTVNAHEAAPTDRSHTPSVARH